MSKGVMHYAQRGSVSPQKVCKVSLRRVLYVEAFSKLAKESNTLLLPANAGDPAAMVAQALGVFGTVSKAVRGGEEKAGEGQGAQ